MHIVRFSDWESLRPWAEEWRALARQSPFRSWDWNETWWNVYGRALPQVELFLLTAFDDDGRLLGVAPWYLQKNSLPGRVLRFLGDGEVCSDYLGLLAQRGAERRVAQAFAEWLAQPSLQTRANRSVGTAWDLLELCGLDTEDRTANFLLTELQQLEYGLHEQPAQRCWRVELPVDWEQYLAQLSKSHRKQIRRLERRYYDSGRAVLHSVDRPDARFAHGLQILIDLHQRRRQGLQEPGCFASAEFRGFHEQIMPKLLAAGRLRLHWLELDGQPIAAEYHLCGDGIVYAYQSGLDPDALEHEPGNLLTMAAIKAAVQYGEQIYDFLRGDEPYKAHWRADPRPIRSVCVVPPTPSARLRYGIRSAGTNMKQWIKEIWLADFA